MEDFDDDDDNNRNNHFEKIEKVKTNLCESKLLIIQHSSNKKKTT